MSAMHVHVTTTSTTPNGQNYDGYQLAYAPDWTSLIGYTHNVPLGDATLRAHIDWSFESSWFGDYVHNRGTRSRLEQGRRLADL